MFEQDRLQAGLDRIANEYTRLDKERKMYEKLSEEAMLRVDMDKAIAYWNLANLRTEYMKGMTSALAIFGHCLEEQDGKYVAV